MNASQRAILARAKKAAIEAQQTMKKLQALIGPNVIVQHEQWDALKAEEGRVIGLEQGVRWLLAFAKAAEMTHSASLMGGDRGERRTTCGIRISDHTALVSSAVEAPSCVKCHRITGRRIR